MATQKKRGNEKMAVGIGAAALAAAAAGAGYYFYASKDAKKHRQVASTWAKGLKREAVKRAKSLKKIDARAIARAVDEAAEIYEGVRGVSAADLRAATRELKANWKKMHAELKPKKAAPKKKSTVASRKRRA